MSKEADKFLHAEQSAQELVQALEELKNETISYRSSAQELNTVREKLSELIDSLLPIAQGTRELISALKSTYPEVIDKISAVSAQVTEQSKTIRGEFEQKARGLTDQLTEQSKTIRGEFEQKARGLTDQLNRLRLLTFIGLSITGLSVVGIVLLLLR